MSEEELRNNDGVLKFRWRTRERREAAKAELRNKNGVRILSRRTRSRRKESEQQLSKE